MPISRAVVHPNVIYAECNTPGAAEVPFGEGLPMDTFYDAGANDITASIAAALAAIGLAYDDTLNQFQVLKTGVWLVRVEFTPVATDAVGVKSVTLSQPGYLSNPATKWGLGTGGSGRSLPYQSELHIGCEIYATSGDVFYPWDQMDNDVTFPAVITYADMSIIQLV